jgi:hypothetical protein
MITKYEYNRGLLIKEIPQDDKPKNLVEITIIWNDMFDNYAKCYNSYPIKKDARTFFEDDKLIYVLAYIQKYLNRDIIEKEDIKYITPFLCYHNLHTYSYKGNCSSICHSVNELKIVYFDEKGKKWLVSFDQIIEIIWKDKTRDEITDFINQIEFEENFPEFLEKYNKFTKN